jgi:hypothetical protein
MGESDTRYSNERMFIVIDADLAYKSKVKVTQFHDLYANGDYFKRTKLVIEPDHFNNQHHTGSFWITLANE